MTEEKLGNDIPSAETPREEAKRSQPLLDLAEYPELGGRLMSVLGKMLAVQYANETEERLNAERLAKRAPGLAEKQKTRYMAEYSRKLGGSRFDTKKR